MQHINCLAKQYYFHISYSCNTYYWTQTDLLLVLYYVMWFYSRTCTEMRVVVVNRERWHALDGQSVYSGGPAETGSDRGLQTAQNPLKLLSHPTTVSFRVTDAVRRPITLCTGSAGLRAYAIYLAYAKCMKTCTRTRDPTPWHQYVIAERD